MIYVRDVPRGDAAALEGETVHVVARMAQQIGALHAELALHAEALEMAEARIAELEQDDAVVEP